MQLSIVSHDIGFSSRNCITLIFGQRYVQDNRSVLSIDYARHSIAGFTIIPISNTFTLSALLVTFHLGDGMTPGVLVKLSLHWNLDSNQTLAVLHQRYMRLLSLTGKISWHDHRFPHHFLEWF
jgi:hypothetical protein